MLSLFLQTANAEIIDKTVASVGEKVITLYDIYTYSPATVKDINKMPEDARQSAWREYYNSTLSLLIDTNILQIAAERMGESISQPEIDDAIIRLRDENTDFRIHVQTILNREGKITPELRFFVQNELLKAKILPILQSRAVVTEQDIYEYMLTDPTTEIGSVEYNIALLFLNDADSYQLFKKTLGSTSFKTAADAAGAVPVNMGWITKVNLVQDIAEALDKMQTGDVSDPVIDTDGRYMVVYLTDMRVKSSISDDMKSNIINKIRMERIQTIYTKWLDKNRQSILVHVYGE